MAGTTALRISLAELTVDDLRTAYEWSRPQEEALFELERHYGVEGLAWLLAFAASLAEVDATFIVRPPGVETLATWVFEQLHNGPEDVVTSVCLASFLGFQVLTLAIWSLARRWLPRGER